jgi:putative protein kinase ArgK-like GTPase of G3E family
MLRTRTARDGMPCPEIVKTDASRGRGLDELVVAIDRHRDKLRADNWAERESRRLEERFLEHLRDALYERGRARLGRMPWFTELASTLVSRAVDPYTAAHEAAAQILGEDCERQEIAK